MIVLNAKNLTLLNVEQQFKFNKLPNGLLTSFLNLEPLTDYEQQELAQIRSDFDLNQPCGDYQQTENFISLFEFNEVIQSLIS